MRSPISRRAGLAVRRLRLARGWTLLCKALEADPANEIVRELSGGSAELPSARRSVRYRRDSNGARAGAYNVTPAAEDLTAKAFTPLVVELFAESLEDHGPPRRAAGEMFVHVIEGCVVLHAEGYRPVTLARGDSMYFDGARNHILLAQVKPARALIVLPGEAPDWA